MPKKKSKFYFIYRSAETGKFVTKQYAKVWPSHTIREKRYL
jgi:hypothetical protein